MPCVRIVEVLPTPPDLFRAAAQEFDRTGREAIRERGRFTVALSGGSTPRSLFSLLAQHHSAFPWAQTFIFFGDERHVPPDHNDSNYRMMKESLLSKVPVPAANVFRVRAEMPDALAAATDYEEQIKKFFELRPGEFPIFDLILLGLGSDGHTASLFPDSDGLNENSRLVIANWVEKLKTHRLTFTLRVLNHARDVMFLVSGAQKAEMVRLVLESEQKPQLPAQRVNPKSRLLWMLDQEAACKLSS